MNHFKVGTKFKQVQSGNVSNENQKSKALSLTLTLLKIPLIIIYWCLVIVAFSVMFGVSSK